MARELAERSASYYLRRAGLVPDSGYVILDDASQPGGAWPLMWPTLRTFSPAQYSSLPGRLMPPWTQDAGFPRSSHVVEYLNDYERRYELPVRRRPLR